MVHSFNQVELSWNIEVDKNIKAIKVLFYTSSLPNSSASFFLQLPFKKAWLNRKTQRSFTQQGSAFHVWALKWKLSLGRLLCSSICEQQGLSEWLWTWGRKSDLRRQQGSTKFSLFFFFFPSRILEGRNQKWWCPNEYRLTPFDFTGWKH